MCSLFSHEAVFDFATLGDSVDSSDQIFPSHIRRHSLQADHGIDGFISGSCKLELANSAEIQFQIHPSASHMGVLHFLQCCSNKKLIAIHIHGGFATFKCGLFPGWTKNCLNHHKRIGRACWLFPGCSCPVDDAVSHDAYNVGPS